MSRVRRSRTYVPKKPDAYVHKHAYVYVIPVQDPRTGAYETYGYIGQTARTWYTGNARTDLVARFEEHVDVQPWRDQIRSPYMLVLWRGSCTQAELDRRERAAILTYRPLYNIEHNRRNPRRIKPWEVTPSRVRTRPVPVAYLALLMLATVVFLSMISKLA